MKKIILTIGVCSVLILNSCKRDAIITEPKGVAYVLDEKSKLKWKGKAADGNANEGFINIVGKADNDFDFELFNGEIRNGGFTIPISSIDVTNLPLIQKQILEGHLKTADFFYMAIHPTVKFNLFSGKPMASNAKGENYMILGEMILLGNRHPLEFPAKVLITESKLQITAAFTFDRSKWGMNYHLDNSYPDKDRILPGIEVSFDLTSKVK
ncbi:YceI family protein [Pedobacter frigoris]|uniref:YceI family protein n=1 Tax=Pedobacter frigoris TaxID=2571272 RepID=A0A4U1CJ68_9SPHI|nr:YceI family protein [Pedobacter frigoris]TKC07463.1 YceI family protein [Pedobacter frigoris]